MAFIMSGPRQVEMKVQGFALVMWAFLSAWSEDTGNHGHLHLLWGLATLFLSIVSHHLNSFCSRSLAVAAGQNMGNPGTSFDFAND